MYLCCRRGPPWVVASPALPLPILPHVLYTRVPKAGHEVSVLTRSQVRQQSGAPPLDHGKKGSNQVLLGS